jgi:hypothetical protein
MKRTVAATTSLPSFNSVLESPPIMLPFPGNYAKVGVVYDVDKIANFHKDADIVLKDIKAEMESIRSIIEKLKDDFEQEWGSILKGIGEYDKDPKGEDPYPLSIREDLLKADEVVLNKIKAFMVRIEELSQEVYFHTASWVVIRLDPWPYAEKASLEIFSDVVIRWIAQEGMERATKLLKMKSSNNSYGHTTNRLSPREILRVK